jgi:signal peptidase
MTIGGHRFSRHFRVFYIPFGDIYKVKGSNTELNTIQADFLNVSRELLDSGIPLRFQARGRSMYPLVKDGDILIVRPPGDREVNIGEVIFFRRPDGPPVAHRVIKIIDKTGGKLLVTRGDSLRYYDAPVSPDNVLGRVIRVERKQKRLALTGWPWRIFGVLIAWCGRGRYPNQDRVVRNLGRLWWMTGSRRIK